MFALWEAPINAPVLETDVPSLLEVLALELNLAAARSQEIDGALSRAIERIPADQREDLLESFHAIDMLSQQLSGLSGFAKTMGAVMREGEPVCAAKALGEVPLGELAQRMRVALGGVSPLMAPQVEAGDIDLF